MTPKCGPSWRMICFTMIWGTLFRCSAPLLSLSVHICLTDLEMLLLPVGGSQGTAYKQGPPTWKAWPSVGNVTFSVLLSLEKAMTSQAGSLGSVTKGAGADLYVQQTTMLNLSLAVTWSHSHRCLHTEAGDKHLMVLPQTLPDHPGFLRGRLMEILYS